MSPLLSCQLMIWLITMHRNEQTLTDKYTHVPHDRREHKCQWRHSLSVLLDVHVAFTTPRLRACVQVQCVYSWHFPYEIMHMCIFIHMHVPMSITVFVSLVTSSFLAFYICCGEGTHLTERENEKWDKSGAKRSLSEEEGEGVNSHAANTYEWHLDRIKSETDRKASKRL